MSNLDRNYTTTGRAGADRAVVIDEGLRAYMIRVYNYMAMGVALTGMTNSAELSRTLMTTAAARVNVFMVGHPSLSPFIRRLRCCSSRLTS